MFAELTIIPTGVTQTDVSSVMQFDQIDKSTGLVADPPPIDTATGKPPAGYKAPKTTTAFNSADSGLSQDYQFIKDALYVNINEGTITYKLASGSKQWRKLFLPENSLDAPNEIRQTLITQMTLHPEFVVTPYDKFIGDLVSSALASQDPLAPASISLLDWIKKMTADVQAGFGSTSDDVKPSDGLKMIYQMLVDIVKTTEIPQGQKANVNSIINRATTDNPELLDSLGLAGDDLYLLSADKKSLLIYAIENGIIEADTSKLRNMYLMREHIIGEDPDLQASSIFASDPTLVSDMVVKDIITKQQADLVGLIPFEDPDVESTVTKSVMGKTQNTSLLQVMNTTLINMEGADKSAVGELTNSDYRIFLKKMSRVYKLVSLTLPKLTN